MRITSNKFMNFFRSLGVKMKAAFLGQKSLVRDLTRGDGGDHDLDARAIATLKTKGKVTTLVESTLNRFEENNSTTPLLQNRAMPPYSFEGSLISLAAASPHMHARDIHELALGMLKQERNPNVDVVLKAAFEELVSELKITQIRQDGQVISQYRSPNSVWEDRARKLIEAYPQILSEDVPSENIGGRIMTYRQLFESCLLKRSQTFIVDNDPSGQLGQVRPRVAIYDLDNGCIRGEESAYPVRNWQFKQSTHEDQARRILTDVNQRLRQQTFQPIVFTDRHQSDNEIMFSDIPMIMGGGSLVGTTSNSKFTPIHANCIRCGISPPIIQAAMPTPAQRERFLSTIEERKIQTVYDLTNDRDGIEPIQCYYNPNNPNTKFTVKEVEQSRQRGDTLVDTHDYQITNRENQVTQFQRVHFSNWPDHGTVDLKTFTPLVERFNQDVQKGAVLVHCKAGVGRSGTVIAASALLDHSKAGEQLTEAHLTRIIVEGRLQRGPSFVQTAGQLELLVEYMNFLNSRR